MKKAVPIGYEDIKEIIDKNLYYIDKTMMIRDLLDSGAKVSLFTRPRRFGKTLNLSMVRRFFEKEIDSGWEQIDNSYLFDGLEISSCGERYLRHQQQYPVISLSLKSAKQPTFDMAYQSIIDEMVKEFDRHRYILDRDVLQAEDSRLFERFLRKEAEPIEYAKGLEFLSKCLAVYHGKNAIILIDEYDVPLENAYFEEFYEEMIQFIRSVFESALKSNPALEFAVITGCLRISKESIFTGLNNLKIYSVLNEQYGNAFGFTQEEVDTLLRDYDLGQKRKEVRRWYNGYLFGDSEIYNPWSIINYVDDKGKMLQAYWSNTSSNSIVRELVEEADTETRRELEMLIEGRIIEKPVHEDITYGDIHESRDNLWNFLFFTGYLKQCGQRLDGRKRYLFLAIPNEEIAAIYEDSILEWSKKKLAMTNMDALTRSIETGDCDAFGAFVSEQLLDTISFFDYGENYYHGFLAGLLKGIKGFTVLSNRESGEGRADIILRENKFCGKAVILELKVAKAFDQMEGLCREALQQIEEKDYEAELRKDGYGPILKYGVCFYKKGCMVRK